MTESHGMITLPRIPERLASRTPQRLPFTPTHVPAAVMVHLTLIFPLRLGLRLSALS